MAACNLLTRTGLDWTGKYPSAVAALANINVKSAYLDGELCGVDDAGFAELRPDAGGNRRRARSAARLLRFRSFAPGRWDVSKLALIERKALLEPLVANKPGLQFNGHDTGGGELILKHAGKLGFEGVVSKTVDAPYAPGNRGLWRKAKALNRQEFVIVGWSDPEGSRPHLGALMLGYYAEDGKLVYTGRVGTGMPVKVLQPAAAHCLCWAARGQAGRPSATGALGEDGCTREAGPAHDLAQHAPKRRTCDCRDMPRLRSESRRKR
jgi:ATP-dependent DNA ligase